MVSGQLADDLDVDVKLAVSFPQQRTSGPLVQHRRNEAHAFLCIYRLLFNVIMLL